MDNTEITVYCTKYALTSGIFSITGEVMQKGKYFRESTTGGRLGLFLASGEFCLHKETAIKKFEEMKARKIKSLENQIKKLKSLTPQFKEK